MLKFKHLIKRLVGNTALKIALYYFLFGFFWILLSDWVLSIIVRDAHQLTFLQTIKGWIFISGTTLLLFFLVYREMFRKNQVIKVLNESRKWHNLLIQNIPDIDVFLIDTNNLCILAQGHTLEKVGLNPEACQNKFIDDPFLDNNFKSIFTDNFSTIRRGEKSNQEFCINNFWFELKGVPVLDDKGEIIAGLLIIIDVTKQKQSLFEILQKKNEIEKLYKEIVAISDTLKTTNSKLIDINTKLTENEQKYKLFFENINDGASIFELTKNLKTGHFLEVNENFAKQLDYTPKELEKLHPAEVFNEGKDSFNKMIARLLEIKSTRFETKCINKKGEAIPFEVSIYLLNIEDKNLFFTISRNISGQIKYIEELKSSKERAIQADKLKELFLTNMSHEIRTPLNGILGFSEILEQDDLTTEKRKKYTDIVKSSSNQLLKLFDNIIELSRIESGQLVVKKNEFDLNKLMDEVSNYSKTTVELNDKPVLFKCSKGFSDQNVIINTDRQLILKIFKILIDNAIKFTEKGEINFGYYHVGDSENIVFYVEDTGTGIPSDKISIIFDSFRQADENLSRQFGGAGIGLSIVKGLINSIGGEITVQSELNRGTRFEFNLNSKFPG
jgi:PAS domain S-box-containing protein